MGKFYFENKTKWEKHRRERAYKDQLAAGGELWSDVAVDETYRIRFSFEGEGHPPKNIRLVDFGQQLVAVEAGNALIGELDEHSTLFMRDYFKKYSELCNVIPAVVIDQDEWNGLWNAKLGIRCE